MILGGLDKGSETWHDEAMPNRSSKRKPADVNRLAASIVEEATEERKPKKNPAAVALGRLGGKKGGPARAKKLTAEQRREIARKAAAIRWGNLS